MSVSVTPRPQIRKSRSKSSAKPKCPKCGGTLVVVKDTDDLTTLVCPSCARSELAEWLATEAGYKAVKAVAKKNKGLLLRMASVDDLTSEIVVRLLEEQCPMSPSADGFDAYLMALAYKVAGGMRNVELEQPSAGDPEVMAATVVGREECELDTVEAWENKRKADAALKERVRRALGKLSVAQQEAIKARFFGKGNLAADARDKGKCDSSQRMNLLRGKRRLAQLIDNHGYAVAA